MSNFLEAMGSLFTFLTGQLTSIAGFFTSTVIGQVIIGIALFSVIWSIITFVISIIHRK